MTTLSQALRLAADKVESSDAKYNWYGMHSCNCGLVAAEIIDVADLLELGQASPGTWATFSHRRITVDRLKEQTCSMTGHNLSDVFTSLLSAGFSIDDFADLERLSNEGVRTRLGVGLRTSDYADKDDFDYTQPENFVAYARAWADLIDENP